MRKSAGGHRGRVHVRAPRRGGPADGDRRAVGLERRPAPFQRLEPGAGQLARRSPTDGGPRRGCPGSRTCRAGPPAARAPARSRRCASSSSTMSPVRTTRSASQSRQASTTRSKNAGPEARGQVQVGELDDPQAVERRGEPGDRHVPLAQAQAERLVAREPQQPGAMPVADQLVGARSGRARSSSRSAASGEIPPGRRLRPGPASRSARPPGRRPCRARHSPGTASGQVHQGDCRCPQSSRADETRTRRRA